MILAFGGGTYLQTLVLLVESTPEKNTVNSTMYSEGIWGLLLSWKGLYNIYIHIHAHYTYIYITVYTWYPKHPRIKMAGSVGWFQTLTWEMVVSQFPSIKNWLFRVPGIHIFMLCMHSHSTKPRVLKDQRHDFTFTWQYMPCSMLVNEFVRLRPMYKVYIYI